MCHRIFVNIDILALPRPAEIPVLVPSGWDIHAEFISSLFQSKDRKVYYLLVSLPWREMRERSPLPDSPTDQGLVIDAQNVDRDGEGVRERHRDAIIAGCTVVRHLFHCLVQGCGISGVEVWGFQGVSSTTIES